MSDQEEKTPWYATEFMGQVYVWSILIAIFLAIGGKEAFDVLLGFLFMFIPGGLIAMTLSKVFYGDLGEAKSMWLLCTIVLSVLIVGIPKLVN